MKKIHRANLQMLSPDSMPSGKEVADEIADVLICLDLLAMEFGVDLRKVTKRKFNESSNKFDLETKFPEN